MFSLSKETAAAPSKSPGIMITVKTFTVNFIEENCYVLSDTAGNAVIIDCGAYSPEEQRAISHYITTARLTPRHLLCTHGHFDHIFGNQYIHDTYGLQPQLHANEAATYAAAAEQMQTFLHRDLPLQTPTPGRLLQDGDVIALGQHQLRVIATPGHTPGGVCFYLEKEQLLFSGDSLFRGSIGRCDLPGGNEAQLLTALRSKILTLPETTNVYPGHGPTTTIGRERSSNPFFKA